VLDLISEEGAEEEVNKLNIKIKISENHLNDNVSSDDDTL
jgi:hypothetical protein